MLRTPRKPQLSGTFASWRGALMALLAAPCALFADVDWSAYRKSFDITFPGYAGTETLTDFPVLVRLSAARNDFDYSKCILSNGGDLRFSDAEGNLLASEVDTWDENGESLVWVRVPSFNADTIITAHYGCASPATVAASDVWSNGYLGVWHLGESERPLRDSTTTGIHFTSSFSEEKPAYLDEVTGYAESDGAVGKAVRFGLTCGNSNKDGRGGLLAFDPEGTLSGFSAMTLEIWAKPDSIVDTTQRYLVSKRLVNNPKTIVFDFYYNAPNSSGAQNAVAYFGYDTDGTTSGYKTINVSGGNMAAKDTGAWYYHVAQFDRTRTAYTNYLNGAFFGRQTGQKDYNLISTAATQDPLCLGNQPDPNKENCFKGSLDELRISNVTRSDAWIKATYDTVNNADFAVASVPNDWKKYSHSFSVSFPGATNGVLSAYPVLVKISESSIPGFSYADCLKENGGDLRFADARGNLLDSEVDTWNTNGVSLVWVNVTSLSNNTAIKAYYGWNFAPIVDSQNVWTNGYVGVWHLGATTLPMKDSTATPANFTLDRDGVAYGQIGIVGNSLRFNVDGETNSYVKTTISAAEKLDGFAAATFEAWTCQYRHKESPENGGYILAKDNGSANWSYKFYEDNKAGSTSRRFLQMNLNGVGSKNAVSSFGLVDFSDSEDIWNYQVFSYDTASEATKKASHYLNGVLNNTSDVGSASITNSASQLYLGNAHNYNKFGHAFPGKIDEVRISNVARSAEWLRTTYDMIKGNASFARYGQAAPQTKPTMVIFR